MTTSAKAIAWTALTSDNKDAYLRQARKSIDRQRLVGIKSTSTQVLEFPRAIPTQYNTKYPPTGYTIRDRGWVVQVAVPQVVIDAQVEEALSLMTGVSPRTELQRNGVKSFSLGNLSESYGSVNPGRLSSYEAQQLMTEFIAGGVSIV